MADTFKLGFEGGGEMTLRVIKPANPDMQGIDVKSWQELLKARGYMPAEGAVDWFYGPKTEEAVKGLQRDYGLEVDGIIGPETGERLIEGREDLPYKKPDQPQINPLGI
jgi:peptidoglycan hydrolase-like protein with peptidoglycan-binding domain